MSQLKNKCLSSSLLAVATLGSFVLGAGCAETDKNYLKSKLGTSAPVIESPKDIESAVKDVTVKLALEKSIVEMRLLNFTNEDYVRTVDISSAEKLSEVIGGIEKLEAKVYDSADKEIIKLQVQSCIDGDDVETRKACKITFNTERSNAVVIGDTKTLLTTNSSLEKFIDEKISTGAAESISDILAKKISIKVMIVNAEGKIILNGLKNQIHISALTSESLDSDSQDSDSVQAVDTNTLLLKADKDLGVPAEISKVTTLENQKLSAVGFSGVGSERKLKIAGLQIMDSEKTDSLLSTLELEVVNRDKIVAGMNSLQSQGSIIVDESGALVGIESARISENNISLIIKLLEVAK